MIEVDTKGLPELIQKMEAYPEKLNAGMSEAMQATLLVMWENVPPYPMQPPGSTYVRKGSAGLGGSLGSDTGGGRAGGQPSIFETRSIGGGFEGHFGSNKDYAPYVIDDKLQALHMGHWWTLGKVAQRAEAKIKRVWELLAEAMRKFMENR